MADGTMMAGGEITVLDEVLGGAPDDLVQSVNDALLEYADPSRNQQEEVAKAAKLRIAFTMAVNWIMSKRMPDLSPAQWIFLSTGSMGSRVTAEKDGKIIPVDLMPQNVYDWLVSERERKSSRPTWAVSILDVEDRVHAIARGELIGLDAGSTRRRKPTKTLGADQLKEKVRSRLDSQLAAVKESIGSVEAQVGVFMPLREEKIVGSFRVSIEALKKYAQISGLPGQRNEQQLKLLNSVGEKLHGIAQSFVSVGNELEKVGRELASRGQALAVKLADAKSTRSELERVESGEATASAAFDVDTIATIRKDEDTIASFAVKGAESAENKVSFSGSRVLVKEQWKDCHDGPETYLASVPGVIAAIEKISKIHLNVFPLDADGQLVLPPIVIEPIRNYIEFFDDRLIMSFVSGEGPRKGAKFSLNPLEVQVLRACGHYLCKDSLYDYRGELNMGTFMGDYSGRVEKKTSVKWVGEDKKFSMGSTSQVVDSASRGEAVGDYMDVVFTLGNGAMPPPKLSRRKLAVMLRYCVIESVEKTVAHVLMHVAQAEPQEAKATILKHGKTEEKSRELVSAAFADPQVAKTCGDKDFFLTKLFGKKD